MSLVLQNWSFSEKGGGILGWECEEGGYKGVFSGGVRVGGGRGWNIEDIGSLREILVFHVPSCYSYIVLHDAKLLKNFYSPKYSGSPQL